MKELECDGKHPFPTQNAAIRVQKKMKNKGRVNVYRCPHCEHWHIGSALGRPKDRR